MRLLSLLGSSALLIAMVFGIGSLRSAEPLGDRSQSAKTAPVSDGDDEEVVTVAMARDRAKLMHKIYLATLEVMHDRYFHSNRAVVPARALEDVFSEMNDQEKIEARWISVNTQAMSIPHEPRTDFEKKAAREIGAGKSAYEEIEPGLFQRATAIPLGDACISCHTGFFKESPKTPRYAGLVLRIPIQDKSKRP